MYDVGNCPLRVEKLGTLSEVFLEVWSSGRRLSVKIVYVAPCSRVPSREHVLLLGRQQTIGYLIIVLVKTIP